VSTTSGLTVSLEAAETNKALVRRWFRETNRRNLAIIDELLPDDYLDHNPPLPDLPAGCAGVRRSVMLLRATFPDAVHTIHDQIAEGDKVMTRLTTHATFLVSALATARLARWSKSGASPCTASSTDGLVEHWPHMDMTGFMRQIGADVGDLA
jgi:predicted ester cyclase